MLHHVSDTLVSAPVTDEGYSQIELGGISTDYAGTSGAKHGLNGMCTGASRLYITLGSLHSTSFSSIR